MALGGSTLVNLTITAIWNHYRNSVQKKKEYTTEQYEVLMRNIVKEECKILQQDITAVKNAVDLNTSGTITLLRNDMKHLLNDYRLQQYITPADKANWHELYDCYRHMGGNHFKEYVDQWKEEINSLPVKNK